MGTQKSDKKAQIVRVSRTPAAPAGVQCANCGTLIGNLEIGCVWQDQPVCYNCYNRLANPNLPAYPQQPPQQQEVIYHTPAPQPIYIVPRKKGHAISITGWALILIGLPLLCVGGVGLIPLIAGIVLIIVGACTGS